MNYYTVGSKSEARFFEKKSEFVGTAAPVKTAGEASNFIAEVTAAHPKARHNVYAYLLRGGECKCSDDGEPQGTGGVPALEVIKKQGLADVCVVITRYFGGVLLGTGGLSRAYGAAARLAADAAERVYMEACSRVEFSLDYTLYGKFSHRLSEFAVKLLPAQFEAEVNIAAFVKAEELDRFEAMLTELTGGRISLSKSNEIYVNFSE